MEADVEWTEGAGMTEQERLRQLPSVDDVMQTPQLVALAADYDHAVLVNAVRRALDGTRERVRAGESPEVNREAVAEQAAEDIARRFAHGLGPAINATGVILHTGLGRAVLAAAAERAVAEATGYCPLAIERETGRRGHRDVYFADLLCELTGAEAATVVNNNAAATMLTLNTLARGREVIVSRGQLVEIGGSFRMPEVMEMSGAVLREVGTTNKTHLRDYAAAIGENTGAILRVHTSNYRILGFAEEPGLGALIELARKHNLPVIDDLGSGALVDLREYGLEQEPMARDSVAAGAEAVCFSGDKLIGGPQCGIIVGRRDTVARIKQNPLARALRIDKLTVAALQATLRLFLNRAALEREHPTYRMLAAKPGDLAARAEAVRTQIRGAAEVVVAEGESTLGSGTAPIAALPTSVLQVKPAEISADALARRLRQQTPPVFPRVQDDAVMLDMRTIQPEEDAAVAQALNRALEQTKS
jgi:L-seryl-tRNA(Ser) seleniumtransferase